MILFLSAFGSGPGSFMKHWQKCKINKHEDNKREPKKHWNNTGRSNKSWEFGQREKGLLELPEHHWRPGPDRRTEQISWTLLFTCRERVEWKTRAVHAGWETVAGPSRAGTAADKLVTTTTRTNTVTVLKEQLLAGTSTTNVPGVLLY